MCILKNCIAFSGLRLFKESKDRDSRRRVSFFIEKLVFYLIFILVDILYHLQHWDNHPAIMAVGIVDGTSEAIFRTLMSLGSSRSE